MHPFFAFCLTFFVGTIGFAVFRLCRVPNPAMLGSMFATGVLNVAGYYPDFATGFVSFGANLLIGVMIGRQIDRGVFSRVVQLGKPIVVQMIGIYGLSLACGYGLYVMGHGEITLATALISGAAGGITEMIIFGMSINEDVAVIAFVQLFRVVISLSIIPYVAMACERFGYGVNTSDKEKSEQIKMAMYRRQDYIPLALAALSGSFIGVYLNIPSGGLIGAMLACGAVSLVINRYYKFPAGIRYFAQICLGLVLGQRMTPEIVGQLGDLFLPALTTTIIMLVGCTLLAFLLRHNTGWDMLTCLLCSAPAGLSQITVFADEIGVDSFLASVFHTVRIIGIVALYPVILMSFV